MLLGKTLTQYRGGAVASFLAICAAVKKMSGFE